MKKLLLTGLFILFGTNVSAIDYIHIDNPTVIIKKLPKHYKFKGTNITNGDFDRWAKHHPAELLAEGYRPITVINNATYDVEIQTRTLETQDIVIFADHCEITYTVTNKNLNPYKKEKGRQIRAEGMAILSTKYSDPLDDGYDTDLAILKAYYKNTIVPLVINAGTLQAVKDINNGDEYTWPSI